MRAFELFGEIFLRDNGANSSLGEIEGSARRVDSSLGKGIKTAAKWGGAMVLAAGTAAAAIGGVALKAAVSYEKQMANVATLLDGDVKTKIKNMGDEVKKMSSKTGTSTKLLTDGLYQVVSAFGETDDSMKILEISAKGAAAGNATVTDSVNLLSAVTKGYGDTSVEATQKASDLAFETIRLGQTTFPELAASMGKVIPLAGAMKVKQEELFGAMSTLTGVTGNTAEVSTQLRGVIQGFMKPTDSMSKALETMGFKTGDAAIESLGLDGALKGLKKAAGGSDTELVNMFGSVEAGTAVLALTGSQADNFTEKTKAMAEATGATNKAFKIQQATTDAMAKKMSASFNVIMISLGEKLLPVLNQFLSWVITHMPEIQKFIDKGMKVVGNAVDAAVNVFGVLVDSLKSIATWVTDNQTLLTNIGIVVGSIAAAWGLVNAAIAIWNTIGVIGAGVTWLMTYGTTAFGLALLSVNWPLVLIVAAIAAVIAIGVLLYKNWDVIKAKATVIFTAIWGAIKSAFASVGTFFAGIWAGIVAIFTPVVAWFAGIFSSAWDGIKVIWDLVVGVFKLYWAGIKLIFSVVKDVLIGFFKSAWDGIKVVWDVVVGVFTKIWDDIKLVFSVVKDVLLGFFSDAWKAIKGVIDGWVNIFQGVWDGIKLVFSVVATWFKDTFTDAWDNIKTAWDAVGTFFSGIWKAITDVFKVIVTWFSDKFTDAWKAIKKVFSGVGSFFGGLWDTIKSKFSTIGGAIGNAIGGAFKKVVNSIINFAENTINGFIRAINRAVGMINKIPGVNISSVSRLYVPRLGYATGTDNATKGLHWVGEEGPELLNFKGGETVTNAKDSANVMSNNKKETSKQPVAIQLVLQNGKAIAEFLIDDLDNLIGNKNKVTARGVGN